nr:peptidase E [Bacteroidota bacterium]
MNRSIRIITISFFLIFTLSITAQDQQSENPADQTIFAFGGEINKAFVKYISELTDVTNPKICYVPTGSADNVYNINYWYEICHDLPVEPHVLKVWVSSFYDRKTFEEILLDMDAIIVGGGNTLNMLAIWKAQGIDTVLQKALRKGIVLAGGSAGSLCWFENGISDSRPVQLSVVDGLSFLSFSHCPHYSGGEVRKNTYHNKILEGAIKPGYGCDNFSGILFKNGRFVKVVSLNDKNNSYWVSVKDGEIIEEKLQSEIIE